MIFIENDNSEIQSFHQRLERTKNNCPCSKEEKEKIEKAQILSNRLADQGFSEREIQELNPRSYVNNKIEVAQSKLNKMREMRGKIKSQGFSDQELEKIDIISYPSVKNAVSVLIDLRKEDLILKGYSKEEVNSIKLDSFPLLIQAQKKLDRLKKN